MLGDISIAGLLRSSAEVKSAYYYSTKALFVASVDHRALVPEGRKIVKPITPVSSCPEP